jgi:predicted alpha/beta-fold hydrolase
MIRFRPHPLFPTGHLQTLAGLYLPWNSTVEPAEKCIVPLDDGDQLVLHDDCPPTWQPRDRTAMLVHGLGGCHQSGYMRRVAVKLVDRGWRVFRMDQRGCGAGEVLARRSTHCGRSDDVAAAAEWIRQHCPCSPLSIVGFSMGGTIALNLACRGTAVPAHVVTFVTVSPPVDLRAAAAHFETPQGRPYDRHFVRLIWKQTVRWAQRNPASPAIDLRRQPRRLRELDERVTAPLAGFASADDYYVRTSPGPHLTAVRIPSLVIASADDPVVRAEPLKQLRLSDSISLLITKRGGHLGFIGQRCQDPDRRWMDWRIIDWLTQRGAG